MKKINIHFQIKAYAVSRFVLFFFERASTVLIGVLLLFVVYACDDTETEETDPCSVLVNGIYQYPTENPDSTMTAQEIKEYWDIPEDVLGCISTSGLIPSCYNTHNVALIMSKDGYQSGYELVKAWNRGFDELEGREDAATELINFYKNVTFTNNIDYGLCCLEVAMAQNSVLQQLTSEQKTELFNLTLDYFPVKKEKYSGDALIYEGTPIIMGRLMMFDNYAPFISAVERNEEISNFMNGEYHASISFEKADTIIKYTENYLQQISL